MNAQSILSTIVLAGALLVSPTYATSQSNQGTTPDDRVPLTQGDTPVQPGVSNEPAAERETPDGALIQGRVSAVEPESGRFVLDTDEGPLSLVTSPEELVGVKVGDVVRVALSRGPRPQ